MKNYVVAWMLFSQTLHALSCLIWFGIVRHTVEKISPGMVMQDDAIQVVGQPADRKILMDAFTKAYGDVP